MGAKLMKSWSPLVVTRFFESKSSQPSQVFRERAIRVVVFVAFAYFSTMMVFDNLSRTSTSESLFWYGFAYALMAFILAALYRGNVRLAGRCLVMSIVLILIDPSRAYWSPGTVMFNVMFTLLFDLVLDNWRDIAIGVALNLGAYTWIVLSATGLSPLGQADYFSNPYLAIVTVYAVNFIIIGVTYYIRREQQERDRMDLLMEQHQVDVLRQFLGNTSHDLRTALTNIRLPLYRLSRILGPDDQQTLASVTRSVGELEKLLLTMLEMSQLDDVAELVMTTVDIRQMLCALVERAQPAVAKKRQHLIFAATTAPLIVEADEEYLTQAIDQVLENAIKFTAEAGTLEINAGLEAEQIILAIRDSGTGIGADKLPYIFNRFFRADEARTHSAGKAGMGLGLSISKKIINLHGGSIVVESVEEKGTTVIIKLPRSKTLKKHKLVD